MKQLDLLNLPFTHQHPLTPLPLLPPYPPSLPPRPHHPAYPPNYQTPRHGSDAITIHILVAVRLIALDPDVAEGDVFAREGIWWSGYDDVAFEGYDALDGYAFGVHGGSFYIKPI